MTSETDTFSLITEPWIKVLRNDGAQDEVSLLEVFQRAPEIRTLAGELPTHQFAIMRLLLALLHRTAARLPGDPLTIWDGLWQSDSLPINEIADYLHGYSDRFGLFDPVAPFYQTAGLTIAKGQAGLDAIIADVPNGDKYFTTRGGRHLDRIGFAEAARWVVHAHAYDISGIHSAAVGDPRVFKGKVHPKGTSWVGALGGVIAEGADLRETLLLNLVLQDRSGQSFAPDDRPAWERDPCGPRARVDPAPSGPADLLTWQSRRIRLVRDGDAITGVVLCVGDQLEQCNQQHYEAMTAWRYSEIQSKKAGEDRYYPRTHDPERAVWRGLTAQLQEVARPPQGGKGIASGVLNWIGRLVDQELLDEDYPIRFHIVGMTYGPQNSVVDEIVDDAISFSSALLSTDATLRTCAVNAVELANDAVWALGELAADLALAGGGDPAGDRVRAREAGYFALDARYRKWLLGLLPSTDASAHSVRWQSMVVGELREQAGLLIDFAGIPALVGREVKRKWLDAAQAKHNFAKRLRHLAPAAIAAASPAESIADKENSLA